jgi:hypothetical protein
MPKAHLYEAIHLVNRGIDEAVQGLERLKRAKVSGFSTASFDEKVVSFEMQRASLNEYFCNNVERAEHHDTARFEDKHREYEKQHLDEVQVYRDTLAVEDRRRSEGRPPKVRFLSTEEQQAWDHQYPKVPDGVVAESPQIERHDP